MRRLNIALLIVNLSALATIVFMARPGDPAETTRDIRSVHFLREQLDLTDEQFHEIVDMSERTFQRYNRTLELICRTNVRLLEEMARQKPDANELRRMTGLIGRLHTNLKNLTVEYFETVRGICSEEQNAKLAFIFKDIMQLEAQCEQCNIPDCESRDQLLQVGLPQNLIDNDNK